MTDETNDPARIVADEANSEHAKARRVLDGYTALETPLDTAVVYALAPHVWAVVPAVKRGDGDGELFVYCRSQVDAQRLAAALSEYERLRHVEAENEALREIAQAVAEMGEYNAEDDGEWITHHDLLPWAEKARALLADTPPTRQDATQRNNDE